MPSADVLCKGRDGTMQLLRFSALVALVAVCHGAAKVDERDCEGAPSPPPLSR